MALSPEDKSEMQAIIVDAVGTITNGVIAGLQKYLSDQLLEIQSDIEIFGDKLTGFESDLEKIRLGVARLQRDKFKEIKRAENDEKQELLAITEVEKLRYLIKKLTARVDAIEPKAV